METFILDTVDFIESLDRAQVYAVLVFIAYVENVIPPIPGDVLVAFGGYLAAEGILAAFPLLAFTTAASVAGFMTAYAVGQVWGARLPEPDRFKWPGRLIDGRVVVRATRWMRRWGLWVVVANRFLAGTRSVIALSAGLSGTGAARTALASTISSLLWNSILIVIGWVVRENWALAGSILNTYGQVVLALLALLIALRLLLKLRAARSHTGRGGPE